MIIATLTTLPSRIAYLAPVINSMLGQSSPPDEIHLQLSRHCVKENCGYELPEFLKDYPQVKIFWHEQDYGPATKWLPTLNYLRNQEVTLLIMDDDCFYPRDMVANLLKAHKANPDKVYCSTGGAFMGKKINHLKVGPKPQKNMLTILIENTAPQRVDTVQGFSLVLFNPGIIETNLVDQLKKHNLNQLADDILLSALFEKSGIERIQIAPYQVPQPLEQAEINPIHGEARLVLMTLEALNWTQQHLGVWAEYDIATEPKDTLRSRLKRRIKGLLKGG